MGCKVMVVPVRAVSYSGEGSGLEFGVGPHGHVFPSLLK